MAGVGDCLNRLTHVSSVALDHRFDAHVAERAAVRYDAARYCDSCLEALKALSGPEVREGLRRSCDEFDESLAKRLLDEEAMPSSSKAPKPLTAGRQALKSAFEHGGQVCLLWSLGACNKSEESCS